MDYYLLRHGEQSGPYLEDAIRAQLQSGELRPADLAWCDGAEDWTPISQLLGLPAGEPASPRQHAFLVFMGATVPAQSSRHEASVLVNDAMEKDPSRLTRWNSERLKLHPDIFADEIQALKEGRSQRFFEHCQREGAAWFEKVAKAHCQVLIGHLDVDSPHWDAHETEAATKFFFPALAKKFPLLLTAEGRSHFHSVEPSKAPNAPKKQSSPVTARSQPSSSLTRKVLALVRGAIYGVLILTGLWFGRGTIGKFIPAATASPPAAAVRPPAPAETAAPASSTSDPTPPAGALPTTATVPAPDLVETNAQ